MLALVLSSVATPSILHAETPKPHSDPAVAHIQQLEKAGQFTEARARAEELLAKRQKRLGPKHVDVADALEIIGELLFNQGEYAKSREYWQRALTIRESLLGSNHVAVADALEGIAVDDRNLGEYEHARPLYERVLRIRRSALGPKSPDTASALNNLGVLYRAVGDYSRARQYYERALVIWRETLGPNDPILAKVLHNLGTLYQRMGARERALPLAEQALAIREKVLSPQHPDIASSLNLLGTLHEANGDYGEAQALYQRALDLRQRALGPHHGDVAMSLNNLAVLYRNQGRLDEARPLFERSLRIREETLGPDHPSVALALRNLGMLQLAAGQYDESRRLVGRALRIRRAAVGAVDAEVATDLAVLAMSYVAQNRLEALPLYAQSLEVSEQVLRRDRLGANDELLEDLLKTEQRWRDPIYSLPLVFPSDARARRLALSCALLRKGRLQNEAKLLARTISRSLTTPEDHEQLMQLLALRRRIATLELSAIQPKAKSPEEATNVRRRALDESSKLAADAEAIEDALAQKSAPLRRLRELPGPRAVVDTVAHALPPGAVLVELLLFQPLRSAREDWDRQAPEHYLALVLDGTGDVKVTDLGEAQPIDQAAATLHAALGRPGSAPHATRALGQLIMSKLEPLIRGHRQLYLAPDGELNLVPFAALEDEHGLLLDRYGLTYLTSGLDLLPEPKEPSTNVVVVADPDFSAAVSPAVTTRSGDQAQATRSADPAAEDEDAPALPSGDEGTRAMTTGWPRLLGTRREAEAIHQLLPQASLLLGRDATKTALMRLPPPGILHVATHGWFVEDPDARRPTERSQAAASPAAASVPPNSLLRSALVLAGANGDSSQHNTTDDTGVLTALEMAQMNLWGTQLVVLSACDTGRGLIKSGQGVYGLRRALRIAGAETVVMSLWKIDDRRTRDLMVRYYRNLIAGVGRAESMRRAMLELRAERPDPSYWAAFFVLGRDEPLRNIHPTAK
jgi:CHAT domain-containing protein/Tfp pilus assembly protein PilF